MKISNPKIFLSTVALAVSACVAPTHAYAFDFKSGDLYYNILTTHDAAVEVTRDVDNAYEFTSVTIPSSVDYDGKTYTVVGIGNNAFRNCVGLVSVNMESELTYFDKNAFYNCRKLQAIAIPDGISEITPYCFYNCESLGEVTIPESVKKIGSYAFIGCASLTDIEIPDNVTEIGAFAFQSCSGLESVSLGNSVTTIGEEGFAVCEKLTQINLPSTLTSIGEYAFFDDPALLRLSIPASVSKIGMGAFGYCSRLSTIEVNESNPSFTSQNGVLYSKDRTELVCCPAAKSEIQIPSTVSSINAGAFWGCELISVIDLPSTVSFIGQKAFDYCISLKSIVIPEGVTTLDEMVFYQCENMESVVIPTSVTFVAWNAFGRCTALKSIFCNGTVPPECTYEKIFEASTFSDATLYVPQDALEEYKNAYVWGDFEKIESQKNSSVDEIYATYAEQETEYFTIDGRRTHNPEKGQFLIKRQGNKVSKVVIR